MPSAVRTAPFTLVLLGCATSPAMEAHTSRAIALPLVKGDRTHTVDRGAAGAIDVATDTLEQRLTWEPGAAGAEARLDPAWARGRLDLVADAAVNPTRTPSHLYGRRAGDGEVAFRSIVGLLKPAAETPAWHDACHRLTGDAADDPDFTPDGAAASVHDRADGCPQASAGVTAAGARRWKWVQLRTCGEITVVAVAMSADTGFDPASAETLFRCVGEVPR